MPGVPEGRVFVRFPGQVEGLIGTVLQKVQRTKCNSLVKSYDFEHWLDKLGVDSRHASLGSSGESGAPCCRP